MRKDVPGIAMHEVRWHPQRGISVPIFIADNRGLLGEKFTPIQLPTEAYAGYGVRQPGLVRMVKWLGRNGHHAVGVDLPLTDKALRGRRDLVIQLAREGPHVVAEALRHEYKMEGPIRAVGHSKGASIVGRAMDENHAGIGDVALIQSPELVRLTPLNVSRKEEQKLIRDFVRDVIAGSSDQETNLAELRAAGAVLATIIPDQLTGQFQVISGPVVTGSLVEPGLTHVQKGNIVLVTATGGDGVFSARKTLSTLREAAKAANESGTPVKEGGRLVVQQLPHVPHINVDAPQGRWLLNTAMNGLENPDTAFGATQIYPTLIAA